VLEALRSEHPDKFDALCSVPVPFRIFSDEYECKSDAWNPTMSRDVHGST
jgi:hypothetical protein